MAYDDAFAAAPHLDLHIQACPRFVDFVEQGVTGGDELLAAAHDYLDPLAAAGVDTLILGCTHYPLLTGVISYVMGDEVTLVSSAEECAKDVYKMLASTGLMRDGGEPDYSLLDHGQPGGLRDHRPPLPRPRAAQRAPSSPGADRMRLTIVGCSGSYPGPDSAGQLLPPRGRRTRDAPGGSCSTSATARSASCTATSTR